MAESSFSEVLIRGDRFLKGQSFFWRFFNYFHLRKFGSNRLRIEPQSVTEMTSFLHVQFSLSMSSQLFSMARLQLPVNKGQGFFFSSFFLHFCRSLSVSFPFLSFDTLDWFPLFGSVESLNLVCFVCLSASTGWFLKAALRIRLFLPCFFLTLKLGVFYFYPADPQGVFLLLSC